MRNYFGVGVSPIHITGSTNVKLIDRKVRVTELILRCSIFALALVSASLVATDVEVREVFAIQKKAKYTNMKALVFLVVVNGVAGAYSLMQVVRCVVSMIKGNVLFSKPLAWSIFSGDQAVGYLCVAGVAAAGQSAAFAKLGESDLQWIKICDAYGKFCNQVGEGIASAFFASIGMVLVSCISAFGLFRLYDRSKIRHSSSWWKKASMAVLVLDQTLFVKRLFNFVLCGVCSLFPSLNVYTVISSVTGSDAR